MKPSPFTYHRPHSVDEALTVLAEVAADGKVLAGGQSLVPLLSMRLAAPAHLVDINHIPGLDSIEVADGLVRIGAAVRHAALEHSDAAASAIPLLRQTVTWIAHPTIRNRGTSLGSIVHADPAGELPAVLALLDGEVEAASTSGRRRIAAAEFFLGPLESALVPGELAVTATFRVPAPGSGSAWTEVARRHGDYAVCGVGATVTVDDDRIVTAARVALISVGPVPVLVDLAEQLTGQDADHLDVGDATAMVLSRIDAEDDIHASARYRRQLAQVLTGRALRAAVRHGTGLAAA